ncbi:MAG: biotin/lipoyl-binding protein, partial [Deltaproteobacteria bacterium]|nr:biotin/lipoyl-binding protein [Nannocystaceae bacterium]
MKPLGFAFALALVLGCHGRPLIEGGAKTEHRHPVDDGRIATPGVVEPWQGAIELAAAEPGLLVELPVAEGESVARGDVVARLEDSLQRHALSQAEAELRETEAELAGLAADNVELRQARAELRVASAESARRDGEVLRDQPLARVGIVSSAELDRSAWAA